MKKLFITILTIVFISTSMSFANVPNSTADKLLSELDIIHKDLTLITKMMMNIENKDAKEIDKIKQIIKRDNSIIDSNYSVLNNLYTNETNIELKKQYAEIGYILSSHAIALNNFSLYVDEPNNIDEFIDGVTMIRNGHMTLDYVENKIKDVHK
ncbi:hypothetical protein CHF27_004325 [Romboutsia maritimum]|uniref:Uncharacterized protein n=1 Tax=Romboutsia maritimum TaxID=2020948 RepID=A0A371IV14_9FIRM|nr:hypothetical protein [Romboutsia maritimum]RDY24316.1 hypothetical protein CHF27_004325 [Romboutsia maritimum]